MTSKPIVFSQTQTLKKAPDKKQYGATGTINFGGIISGHEYLPELQGLQLVDKIDRMLSDPTVGGAFRLTTLPILSAEWSIEPGDNPEADAWAERCLFNESGPLTMPFASWLAQVLDYLPYGRMAFEKIWAFDKDEGKWYWQELAPRLPKTIYLWKNGPDGNLESIVQQVFSDATGTFEMPTIPADKLILFVNERKGNNYEGRSFFRAAYKAWDIKSKLEIINAMAGERHGMGVSEIQIPDDADEQEAQQALDVLENLYAAESIGIVTRQNWTYNLHGLKGTAMNLLPAIKYYDERIAYSMIVGWSMLGMTGRGSRATGEVQQDPYYLGLMACVNYVISIMQSHIRQLVDLNFSGVKKYPQLKCEKLRPKNIQEMGEALKNLAAAGYNLTDLDTENEVRGLMGLTPVDEAAKEAGRATPAGTVKEQQRAAPASPDDIKLSSCGGEHFFAVGGITEPGQELNLWREPRGPENYVALADIADGHLAGRRQVEAAIRSLRMAMTGPFVEAAQQAAHTGSPATLADFVPQNLGIDNAQGKLRRIFAGNWRRGVREVDDEIARQREGKTIDPLIRQRQEGKAVTALEAAAGRPPSIPQDVWDQINLEVSSLAQAEASRLRHILIRAYSSSMAQGTIDINFVRKELERSVDEGLANIASQYGAWGFARGRDYEALAYAPEVKEVHRSGILDEKICGHCEQADGESYPSQEEADAAAYLPDPDCAGRDRCRCIYISVLARETEPTVKD
ncbi:MAG: hypothetical protein M0Z43_04435 [Acidithiobacillus sp.]|nr:hypothetical protein [Acidithiobacillus sp.]